MDIEYLIPVEVSCHCTGNIIKKFQRGNKKITFIHLVLTRFYKPVDFNLNKIFKP